MFDIGFTELLLIAVISLVVLGPERLPGAIRKTAYWIGKVRRCLQSAKEELERELDVDGIKRQIHNEEVMKELEKTRAKVMESVNDPLETLNKTTSPASNNTESTTKPADSKANG